MRQNHKLDEYIVDDTPPDLSRFEKLFQHPIHQEFTKSYNRLYARIRRGKLSADTPLMGQLKALHDEYTEKYENTHKKNRGAVWKEYIEKNKELLILDFSKS